MLIRWNCGIQCSERRDNSDKAVFIKDAISKNEISVQIYRENHGWQYNHQN